MDAFERELMRRSPLAACVLEPRPQWPGASKRRE